MKRVLTFLFFGLVTVALAGIISGGLTFLQITTPANPASGSNKLYFKSDNKLYSLTSAGTEAEIGAGGSAFSPLDAAPWYFREDFASAFFPSGGANVVGSETTWSVRNIGSPSGGGVSAPADSDTSANPGQVIISSGTTSTAGKSISLDPYTYNQGTLNLNTQTFQTRVIVKVSSATQIGAQVGWTIRGEPIYMDGNNGFWLYYSVTSTGGAFTFRSKSYGGTTGSHTTSVTVDTSFHAFDLRGDGAKLYASIDGGTEVSFCPSGCDVTATLPVSGGYVMSAGVTTADGTNRDLTLDFAAHITTLAGATASKRN